MWTNFLQKLITKTSDISIHECMAKMRQTKYKHMLNVNVTNCVVSKFFLNIKNYIFPNHRLEKFPQKISILFSYISQKFKRSNRQ